MSTKGLYQKYRIEKTDGTHVDPKAKYFVLRIDTDPHARIALQAYSDSILHNNPDLAADLMETIKEFDWREIKEQAQRAEANVTGIEETLFVAVDNYLYDDFLEGYTENHCNPEKLLTLHKAFLAMLSTPPNPLLEQLAQAETATQEAVAREAVLVRAFESVWEARMSAEHDPTTTGANIIGWVFYLDKYKSGMVRDAFQDRSTAATALLERLAELETETTDLHAALQTQINVLDGIETHVLLVAELHGALQAALLPLERAADALVPPGARVEEAAGLVEEAIEAIREELE